jgi:hypothetical protein
MHNQRVEKLQSQFQQLGYSLSDSLTRSLQIGHDYAARHDYVPATDVLLHGLFHSNNAVASIASELTPEPDRFNEVLDTEIHHYRKQAFPPELTFHCSRGFPQYSTTTGYTDPTIDDSNSPVYDFMIKRAKKDKSKKLENRHLFNALLQPQRIRYWSVIATAGMRSFDRPTLANDVLTELGINPIQLTELVDTIGDIEAAHEAQKFVLYFDGKKFRVRPFDLINGYRIVEAGESQLFVAKANLIDHSTLLLTEEVEEFEWLINRSDVSEHEIQKFFEQHPKFLLGVEYKNLHAQLTLHREDLLLGSDLRPDFFLERITSNFCDIVDLKLPNERLVVRKKNRTHFSAALTEAMAQLREYRDHFDNPKNREQFHDRYKLQAFRPRVSVIIGRRANYYDELERIKLESDLAHLKVVTYDDLLEQARRRLLIMQL